MTNPLLSVCVTTYNHEKFIAEAIESILNQQTSFEFEIIIGEDESSDETRAICLAYQKKFPEKIRVILRSRKDVIFVNGHPTGRFNFSETIKAARGKYIALLEGDDYWTDSLKLQKQVDILEANPDCICCHHWHKLAILNPAGQFELQPAGKENHGYYNPQISSVAELFRFRMRTQTRTMMFRNIFKEMQFPSWFYKGQFGDLSLAMILGKFGNFYFIDEEMAAYRVTGHGASTIFNNEKGYISGNKAWLTIWAYALSYHEYKYTNDALTGMGVFISRIRKSTENSLATRLNLMIFVLLKMKMNYSVKRKLIKDLMKSVQTN